MSIKKCIKDDCKVPIEEQEFGKSTRHVSGYQNVCKVCRRIANKLSKDKPANKAKEAAKRNTATYKEAQSVYNKGYRSRPGNKKKAKDYQISDKVKKKAKEYRQTDAFKQSQSAFKNRNPEYAKNLRNTPEAKAKKKAYDKAHAEQIKAYRNSEVGKLMQTVSRQKRRAQKEATEDGTVTAQALQELRTKQNGKCYHCGELLDFSAKGAVHLDHYIPLSRGGTHTLGNVVWSCPTCNLQKHAKVLS